MAKRLTRDELISILEVREMQLKEVTEDRDSLKRSLVSAQQSASNLSNQLAAEKQARREDIVSKNNTIEQLEAKIKRLSAVGHTNVDHFSSMLHDAIDAVDITPFGTGRHTFDYMQ
jgi:hypothetical protein